MTGVFLSIQVLTAWSRARRKLISLYLTGYRVEAIRIMAHDVMLPRGLVGMGFDTLDQSGEEIAQVRSSQHPYMCNKW